MKMLLRAARRHGLCVKRFVLDDVWEYCKLHKISVIWSVERFSFYFCVAGFHFIVLPQHLHGNALLFAALHELAHAAISPGTTALFGSHDSKDEAQADAIALVSMMPDCELLDDDEESWGLWEKRLAIRQQYGV